MATFLLVALLTLATTMVFGLPPAAAADCGAQGNWFDGYLSNQPTGSTLIVGVIGTLRTESGGFPCTTSGPNDYSAWTMMTWSSHYAQTGYARSTTDSSWHWFEEDSSSIYHQIYYAGDISLGSNYTYSTYGDSTCSCFREYAALTQLWTTSWNPFQEWSQPWNTQMFGEVQRYPDQMVGSTASHASFVDLKARYVDSDWTGAMPTLYGANDAPARWSMTPVTTCLDGYQCFDIWDIG
jgi:hypothetical protein